MTKCSQAFVLDHAPGFGACSELIFEVRHGPLGPTPLRTNTNVGDAPPLTQFHRGKGGVHKCDDDHAGRAHRSKTDGMSIRHAVPTS